MRSLRLLLYLHFFSKGKHGMITARVTYAPSALSCIFVRVLSSLRQYCSGINGTCGVDRVISADRSERTLGQAIKSVPEPAVSSSLSKSDHYRREKDPEWIERLAGLSKQQKKNLRKRESAKRLGKPQSGSKRQKGRLQQSPCQEYVTSQQRITPRKLVVD